MNKEQGPESISEKHFRSRSCETKKGSAHDGIRAFVRGSSTRFISSRRLEWEGIGLEVHNASPVERCESRSAHHLITLFTNHVSRGESSTSQGRFAPYSYFPGTFNLSPAGPIPACRPLTDTRFIVCALEPGFLNDVRYESDSSSAPVFRPTTNLRDHSLRSILLLLAAEARADGLSGKLYVEHLTHALAHRVLHLVTAPQDDNSLRAAALPGHALQRVLERMKAELASNLSLNTLAAESGYSKSHFLRMFRACMGCSPHQWLTRLRVGQAKKMLRQNSTSLIDIAAACGFSSQAHFSKSFRQIAGVAPSQYRRAPELFM